MTAGRPPRFAWRRLTCQWIIAMLIASAGLPLVCADDTRASIEFFEAKVRPILVEHCYECHSVDAEDIEGGLLLDSKWGWEKGGDSGSAIVPGNVDDSLLIEAVRYEEDVVSGMPPKSKLAADKIAVLEQWVAMGAPDPRPKAVPHGEGSIDVFDLQQRVDEHWSWRPISEPSPPSVQRSDWPINDVDRFILARVESAGLQPALDADKRIWIRRVYFDLIGLPPTPDQVAEFLADDSDGAHRRVVDDLLSSDHFGEAWARHWMDLVRYADTYGHEFDYELKYAFEYRDYLIRAFNADVPFDQFVREHIAGDLLSNPRRHPSGKWNESIIGTGFWYLHEATHSPTDVLGNEADIVDNQIDVFGKAFLGLTVACARCHDHKFDAISTADYYGLSAYLQSSCRQETTLDEDLAIASTSVQIDRLRRQAKKQLRSIDSHVAVALRPGVYYETAARLIRRAAMAKDVDSVPTQWISEAASARTLDEDLLERWVEAFDRLILKEDHRSTGNDADASADTAHGAWQDFESGSIPSGWSTTGTAFHPVGRDLELRVDGSFAKPGTIDSGVAGREQVGILRSPTFELTTRQIHLKMKATADVTVRVIIDNYHMAHFNALLFKGTFINGEDSNTDGKWAWKSLNRDLRKYLGHRVYLEVVDEGDATVAIDEIRFSNESIQDTIDHSSPRHAALANQLWRQGIQRIREGRSSEFVGSLLDAGLISIQQLNARAGQLLSRGRKLAQQLPPPRFAVAMAAGSPEDAHVYIRGSHTSLGDRVPARILEALGGASGSRLELAERVASDDNPLTARVIVNRLWHHLFGRGIVASVDDFGPQGELPSHPELLDWLARDFVDHGWSLKHTIKQLVLSKTYRQNSVAHPDLDATDIDIADPTNRLLHRMPVRRLSAEAIRDAILLVSGRLDRKQFGPSVPTFRTPFMTGRGARPSGPLDGDGRRSIYLSVYRNFLNPFMLTFDAPSPFGPSGRRSQSNVPAQILTLMNDPFVVEQAGNWADAILRDPTGDDRQRISKMLAQAHGVEATEREVELLNRFLDQQTKIYGRRDRRSWADLAHVLLNMKAFYFVR